MEDHKASSIELYSHTNDGVDEDFIISSKTASNRSVVITYNPKIPIDTKTHLCCKKIL